LGEAPPNSSKAQIHSRIKKEKKFFISRHFILLKKPVEDRLWVGVAEKINSKNHQKTTSGMGSRRCIFAVGSGLGERKGRVWEFWKGRPSSPVFKRGPSGEFVIFEDFRVLKRRAIRSCPE